MMKSSSKSILGGRIGPVSADWIVLTGALVGTGAAVVSDLGDHASTEAYQASQGIAAGRVQGAVAASAAGAGACVGGIDRLQTATASQTESTVLGRIASMGDKELRRAFERIRPMAERDETVMTALECEMVRRGFGG